MLKAVLLGQIILFLSNITKSLAAEIFNNKTSHIYAISIVISPKIQ